MIEKASEKLQYNKKLKGFAGGLRNESTKAEVWLWKFILRNKQMKGYTFNRQRPVLNFIADFMCKPLMLVIEVDGVSHEQEITKQKDAVKTQALVDAGYTVLRFTDDDVLSSLDWVEREIIRTIEELEPSLPRA